MSSETTTLDDLNDDETIEEMSAETGLDEEYHRQAIEFQQTDELYQQHTPTPDRTTATDIARKLKHILISTNAHALTGTVSTYSPPNSNDPTLTLGFDPDPNGITATTRSFDIDDDDDHNELNRLLQYLDLPTDKPSKLSNATVPLKSSHDAIHNVELDTPPAKPLSKTWFRYRRTLSTIHAYRITPDERYPIDYNRRAPLFVGAISALPSAALSVISPASESFFTSTFFDLIPIVLPPAADILLGLFVSLTFVVSLLSFIIYIVWVFKNLASTLANATLD